MIRLALLLHGIVGATLMGTAVVAALVSGHDTLPSLLLAAALGFVVAIPVSLLIAKRLS